MPFLWCNSVICRLVRKLKVLCFLTLYAFFFTCLQRVLLVLSYFYLNVSKGKRWDFTYIRNVLMRNISSQSDTPFSLQKLWQKWSKCFETWWKLFKWQSISTAIHTALIPYWNEWNAARQKRSICNNPSRNKEKRKKKSLSSHWCSCVFEIWLLRLSFVPQLL